jgi:hypothetical protein
MLPGDRYEVDGQWSNSLAEAIVLARLGVEEADA